jgi:2-polyprenyl-6-methoxyphenol hydroxylase-like FAD-dependent oxidoreductase
MAGSAQVKRHDTSVLIVGGGLVGLSAALFLRHHGVDCMLVERRKEASVLPRSRGVHIRTVELFRQIGIEERVQQVARGALKAGAFGGARTGSTMVDSVALDFHGGHAALGADPSPSGFCFCPQVLLEPVLADLARERGAEVRFGSELSDLRQDPDRVTATVDGRTLTADYLIAADGAGSPVRELLGITSWTLPATHHYVNVFVHADLTALVEGRTFSQCEIANEQVRGLILAKNNTDEWSFHFEYDPEHESMADFPPRRCVELVRAAVGGGRQQEAEPKAEAGAEAEAGLEVEVLAASTWDTAVHVANEYRRGRVLLAGDSAHRHAPWGGFGANTGIADAHNLAWKLAAVLAGHAGPVLLDSYEAERRPRAVLAAEQARLRTDFLARYGIVTEQTKDDVARQLDAGAIMTRYRYVSPAVMSGAPQSGSSADGASGGGTWVEELSGQVGTRLPHLQLRPAPDTGTGTVARGGQGAGHGAGVGAGAEAVNGDGASSGEEFSTLDLCGPGFTLLTGPNAAGWDQAVETAAKETGLTLAVHRIGGGAELVEADREQNWAAAHGLPSDGALLVRPDEHVAARSDEGLRPEALSEILRSLVCHDEPGK